MTFKTTIKEILPIYCVYKLFISGIVFIGLIYGPHCLKGLMHGSSLNITIITRLHFPFFLSVIKFAPFYHIFHILAVLVIAFSHQIKVKKLLEAAWAILLQLSFNSLNCRYSGYIYQFNVKRHHGLS